MSETDELIHLNQQLLDSIVNGEWETYAKLCDPSMSAFEPEAVGCLVEGMDFHRFYFELGGMSGINNTIMCSPHVRILGDTAIVCCFRLIQRMQGITPETIGFQETRVWHKAKGGAWKHVHFHRSPIQTKWPTKEI